MYLARLYRDTRPRRQQWMAILSLYHSLIFFPVDPNIDRQRHQRANQKKKQMIYMYKQTTIIGKMNPPAYEILTRIILQGSFFDFFSARHHHTVVIFIILAIFFFVLGFAHYCHCVCVRPR